ncbi:hypothetical protein SAMN04489729_8311 [Amycolatopsis lurida]|uniref:AMIN-like domain-containing protein n=1 Tax=Amycolatopsis lurida NRRL 2430 TaxID=1460371 RepID=A0A2P2FI51_AMYLU|nr:hypothetical protein [Amycolatopsis lurida]KFU76395.1 hypothetical protein BB31_36060 [Amycolatopsis lurida NRRL 2430]SEE60527.1 hypothetical protein SAMN04489729_8311 [Amycolatopsis lurida]
MTITLRRALAATVLMMTGAIAAVTPVSAAAHQIPAMTGLRTGQNPGFDRVVLDLTAGPAPAVRYDLVDELIADGSGEIVWLTGEFFIAVTATPAAAHDDAGNSAYPGPQKFRTRNLRNVMAVAVTGDYEGTLSIGLGVRSRTPVTVFTLTSPNRVVIDVRH